MLILLKSYENTFKLYNRYICERTISINITIVQLLLLRLFYRIYPKNIKKI